MTDEQQTTNDDKIEKALELLQEAGFDDIVVVGKAFGKKVSTTVFHDNYGFDDVAEMQGYLQQEQIQLSAKALVEQGEEPESASDDDE